MGFDAGILQDEHTPSWPFQPGYPDWGGEAWRQPTDAARWMKYSVFWFSQQVAHRLGPERFQSYVDAFDYGNRDVSSGDPSELNGMNGAWNISSLRISPLEQLGFLERLVNRRLPVSARAYEMTVRITSIETTPDGWEIHGKPGTGSPGFDGHYDASRAYGWFVGWASRGTQTLVFARLTQDEQAAQPNAGMRTRDQMLKELPRYLNLLASSRS